MAMISQGPPESGGKLPAHVVDGDDVRLVADPPLAHRPGERFRAGDLRGDRVVEVDDVLGPVDEDRAGDVAGGILFGRPSVRRLLDPRRDGAGGDVPPDVDDPDIGVAEVLLEPFGRDERVDGHRQRSIREGAKLGSGWYDNRPGDGG